MPLHAPSSPTQVASANLAFTPTAEVLANAQRVVDAAEKAAHKGNGVFTGRWQND
jgi:citrate lyase beta subunit